MVSRKVCGFVLLTLGMVSSANASDAVVLRAHDRDVPALVRAVAGAHPADRPGIERAYARARDLQVRLSAGRASTEGCGRLHAALTRLAYLGVAVPDGFDRLEPRRARAFAVAFARQRRVVAARVPDCRVPARRGHRAVPAPVLLEPVPHSVTRGVVQVVLPAGTTTADLLVDGRRVGALTVRGARGAGVLPMGPGRHSVAVRAWRGERILSGVVAHDVWAVPGDTSRAGPSPTPDIAASRSLERAAARFDGIAAAWVLDTGTGRVAAWNADARFPAASMVKLGVMIEAARRMGASPGRSPLAADVVAIGGWSSNLAVNRLLPRVGGARTVERRLQRMGATRSTFTGGYQVASESGARAGSPPAASRRVTTAADLGRVLHVVHASARGDVAARRGSGLTPRQARFVLGTLYGAERRGDNAGILGVPASSIAAQKHGWIRSVRHSAAIIATADGPRIVVAMTWSPGLTRARARVFGAEVLGVASRM